MSDVSVVMGTYNGERHIEEQVTSILQQSQPPAEIVVCDDGSTDSTLGILTHLRASSSVPIVIHRNETRLGFSDNFLKAAQLAQFPYIAFSDQDDRWHPAKLQQARTALDRFDAAMSTHQVVLMSAQGEPIGLAAQMITETRLIEPLSADPFGVYLGFTQMIDRRLLDLLPANRRGPDNYRPSQVLSHDRWVYFLATNFTRSVAIADALASYRQHDAQLFGVNHHLKRVSLTRRFLNKVAAGPARLQFFADLADDRCQLLQEFQPDTDGPLVDVATWKAAARRWEAIATMWRARLDLYRGADLADRVKRLRANVRHGAYRPLEDGGLGQKRLLEDISLGLFGQLLGRW